jgi:chlorobactene glucosyltransferase
MVKYSIVVPAYNEEESIEKCLISLKNQNYRDFEIIVIDNNSTDRTGEIAKKLVKNVFDEKKQGYVFAVNFGAKKAKGTYLSICDADTIYPSSWLEKVNAAFESQKDIAGVYGGIMVQDSNLIINSIGPFFNSAFLIISRLLGMDNTSGFNFVFRKDIFEKVGGYNEKYKKASPDIELGKKIRRYGKLKLDLSIKVYASTRRFEKRGYVKTLLMYARLWLSELIGKEPEMTYSDYNS